MEFFVVFGAIFSLCDPRVKPAYGINVLPVYWAFILALVLYAVFYTFKAIGLSTMAKKREMNKYVWCAFVPFASTWLMGKLAGAVRVGRTKIEFFGLLTMIAEICLCVCYALHYFPLAYAYTHNLYEIVVSVENNVTSYGLQFSSEFQPFVTVMNIAYVAEYIFMIIYVVLSVFLYMGFFRGYAPQSYIWLDVLCIFLPVAGILAFAFRNRKFVDYEKYMQARMEQIRRMQQAQYGRPPYGNPYGNPYGGSYGDPYGGPYGQNGQSPYGGPTAKPDDPFGEFSSGENKSSAQDPFGEFGQQNTSGQNANGQNGNNGQEPKDPPQDPDHFSS